MSDDDSKEKNKSTKKFHKPLKMVKEEDISSPLSSPSPTATHFDKKPGKNKTSGSESGKMKESKSDEPRIKNKASIGNFIITMLLILITFSMIFSSIIGLKYLQFHDFSLAIFNCVFLEINFALLQSKENSFENTKFIWVPISLKRLVLEIWFCKKND